MWSPEKIGIGFDNQILRYFNGLHHIRQPTMNFSASRSHRVAVAAVTSAFDTQGLRSISTLSRWSGRAKVRNPPKLLDNNYERQYVDTKYGRS